MKPCDLSLFFGVENFIIVVLLANYISGVVARRVYHILGSLVFRAGCGFLKGFGTASSLKPTTSFFQDLVWPGPEKLAK
jgi:hypothetical protein